MEWFHHFGLQYKNDISLSDKQVIVDKINLNASLTSSFLALLIGSSIICTLGLLLNSAPVVIGGMIISPLMWPLAKTALGISNESPRYIRHAVMLLVIATLVVFVSSTLVTYISPIKSLTSQILARTTPTLLDLVIALVAGGIAALAVTQKKISESLAGVAIATSLMPPLCVSGIGLALIDYPTFAGGLLLFSTNVVAIIFVSVLIFYGIGIRRNTDSQLRRRGALVLVGILVLLAIPLYLYLKTYTFKAEAYQKTQDILKSDLQQISSAIVVNNITTDITGNNNDSIQVQAQIVLPQNLSVDYSQQRQIINDLQNALHKKVNLTLTIQQSIAIVSEQDVKDAQTKQILQQHFVATLTNINPSVVVDTLTITKKQPGWEVNATLHADPSVVITQSDRLALQKELSYTIGQPVVVNLEITPILQLQSNETVENQRVIQEVQQKVTSFLNPLLLTDVSIAPKGTAASPSAKTVIIDVKLPIGQKIDATNFSDLKKLLENEYKIPFILQVNAVNETVSTY